MMKLVYFLGMLGAFLGCANLQASAQQAAPRPAAPAAAPSSPPGTPLPPATIGIVDMMQINQSASAPKGIREQMEKQLATFQAEIQKRENELRTADQEVQQQRTLLSADAFAERRRGFEQQLGEAQRVAAARKRQLDQAYNDGMQEVDVVLKNILGEIATERALTIILPKQSTLLSANALDLTRDVQLRLDKKLPRVTIKLPPLQK
jgi:Skp family chaperone for outer membrane proteins